MAHDDFPGCQIMGQAMGSWAPDAPPREPTPEIPVMTVQEVIDKLKSFPPNAPVEVHEGDGYWENCQHVVCLVNISDGTPYVCIGDYAPEGTPWEPPSPPR